MTTPGTIEHLEALSILRFKQPKKLCEEQTRLHRDGGMYRGEPPLAIHYEAPAIARDGY
jgi:hypothetical protein